MIHRQSEIPQSLLGQLIDKIINRFNLILIGRPQKIFYICVAGAYISNPFVKRNFNKVARLELKGPWLVYVSSDEPI